MTNQLWHIDAVRGPPAHKRQKRRGCMGQAWSSARTTTASEDEGHPQPHLTNHRNCSGFGPMRRSVLVAALLAVAAFRPPLAEEDGSFRIDWTGKSSVIASI